MVLSAKHIPIRRLVARLLGNNEFRGILHSCGAVADICNVVLPGPDLVSEDLVMASFVGEGENSWKHIQPIELGMDATVFRNKKSKTAKRKCDQLDTDSQPLPPRPEYQQPTQQRPEVKDSPSIPIEKQLTQQTDLLKDLLRQQRDLEAQIATERAKYIELKQASCAAQSDIDDYLLAYNNALVEQDCKTLLVVADGKPGMLRLAPGDDLILYEDIEQSLISRYGPEPALIKCGKHSYFMNWFGPRAGFWMPKGTRAIPGWYFAHLQNLATAARKILKLFKSQYTCFSRRSAQIMSLFGLSASGASDAAKEAMIAGTLKAVLHESGLDCIITDEEFARGCPSESTIANWELETATSCVSANVLEIHHERDRLERGVPVALVTDHTNRKGKGFFAKLLIYTKKDGDKWTLKFICLDLDDCDHTARGAAEAIKKSLARWGLELNVDIVVKLLTGDAGGGAAVQNLHPALIGINVMGMSSRSVRCLMHALNKAFEVACLDCFGSQGINHRGVTQMYWLVVQMFMRIKLQGGLKLLDEYYNLALAKLRSSDVWKAEGDTKFRPAVDQFFTLIQQELDEAEDDGFDLEAEFTTHAPRNITQPTLSRWKTICAVAKICLAHYPVIYFMAIVVIQEEASNYYLCIIAKELASLMIVQPNKSIERINTDDSDSDSTVDEEEMEAAYKPGETPPMYAITVWFVAFCEEYYDDMFDWAMRNDPYFGVGSYGQTSRLCPERAFIMHRKLLELENGGWKTKPRFKNFLDVLPGVARAGDILEGGREYVEAVPDQFLESFRYFLNKHTLKPWRDPKILVLAVGGNNILAKHILRKIFDPQYTPPNTNIILHNHEGSNGSISINLHEAVDFLFEFCTYESADDSELFLDHLIQNNIEDWQRFSDATDDVDLFDEATWPEGQEFTVLKDLVISEIVPLASHQQRVENYMQMAGHISKTGVDEKRCTWRAICQVAFRRPFREKALERVRATKATMQEKARVRRVRGQKLLQHMSEEVTEFLDNCDVARAQLGDDRVKRIKEGLKDKDNKTSADQTNAKIQSIRRAIDAPRKNPKGATKTGIDVPAGVGGKVILQYIAYTHMGGKVNANRILREELKVRGVVLSDKAWDNLQWNEKKYLLKKHESTLYLEEDKAQQGIQISKINAVKPQSRELKSFLITQKAIHRKEKQSDEVEAANYTQM